MNYPKTLSGCTRHDGDSNDIEQNTTILYSFVDADILYSTKVAGKSVGLRSLRPVRRLNATLILVHFSIG